jgi:hypothetical protein
MNLLKLLSVTLTMMAGSSSLFADRIDGEPITNESIQNYLEEHESIWLQRMPAGGSYLFYTEEDWPAVLKRLKSEEGLYPRIRREMFVRARRLAESEPQPYIVPDGDGRGQQLWQRKVGDSIFLLSLAAKLDDAPEYSKALRDLVLTGCEYPHWGNKDNKANMDLACGHMARAVALAWDWHRDLFSEAEQAFICSVMQERVGALKRALLGEMLWGRSYSVNHNHVNVAAMGFAGLAFYHDLPEAREWLAAACLNFDYALIMCSDDGSTVEGVPYWSYTMSFMLQFIEAVRTVTDSAEYYEAPFLENASNYRIASSTPGFHGTLPWGDAKLFDFYGPHHLLARLASQYNDHYAQYLMENVTFPIKGGDDTSALWLMWYDASVSAEAPYQLDYHVNVWDVMTTRSGWSDQDYLLTLKSGYTNRNHSHLDAGALAFVFGDDWLIQTPGYGTGSSNPDFWNWKGKRWTFFSNATESHNTLMVNKQNQRYDMHSRGTIDAFSSLPNYTWTEVDLKEAYNDISEIRREVLHVRDDYILIFDDVSAQDSVNVDWLAQVPSHAVVDDNRIIIDGSAGSLRMKMLEPADGNFVEYVPYSEHVDKRYPNQCTYSIAQSGSNVGFTMLMQPVFKDLSVKNLQTGLKTDLEGCRFLGVRSKNWTDYLWVNHLSRLNSALNYGAEDLLITVSKVTVARVRDSQLIRLFAYQLTSLESDTLMMKSHEPISIELSTAGDDRYVLDLETAFEGSLSVGKEYTLFDSAGLPVTIEPQISLAPGRYFITLNSNRDV